MSIQDPGNRPSGWDVAGDHERRIRALEALENCCGETCSTFDETIATLATSQTLLGWWRAGEPSGDLLDTSGYNGDGLGAADATLQTGANPILRDVTGCLPATQDDGAIEGTDATGADGDFFKIPQKAGRYELKSQNFSLAAWMKPTAIVAGKTFNGVLFNMGFSTAPFGWALGTTSTGKVMFRRESPLAGAVVRLESPVALTNGECAFVVATYDTVDGHKIYVNGSLVATDTQTFGVSETVASEPLIAEGATINFSANSFFYGVMDEFSIWGDALTSDSVVALFHSSLCEGQPDAATFTVYQDGV